MKRVRLLLFAVVAALVTVFSLGIPIAGADQDKGAAGQAAERESLAKQKADADAAQVRAARDAAAQRRRDSREMLQRFIQGEELKAPANPGKEGTK